MDYNFIRENIAKEAEKEEPNHSVLMKLVQELSEKNPNSIRFSVDSGILTRLGEELVGKQETAVCELIKNSYDADATFVNLNFFINQGNDK